MKRLFALIICSSAMIACTSASKSADTAAQTNTTVQTTVQTTVNHPDAAADLPANIQATEKKFEAKEPYGSFEFKYPSFGIAQIDKTIEQYAKDVFEKSKADMSEQYEEIKSNMHPEELADYHHNMTYEIVRTASDGLDILFTHEGYTGGVHGFFFVDAQMIDKSGKRLTLSDIYDDVPKALNRLSEESRRLLFQKISNANDIAEMINSGTEPELDNFSAVLRTDKGLRIYFNPYQVAPWSEGMLTIDIDK